MRISRFAFALAALAATTALPVPHAAYAAPAAAPMMRDDGIRTEPWMKGGDHDLAAAAKAAHTEGKTLLVIAEGIGCPACEAMHNEHFSDPKYSAYIRKHFEVQIMNVTGTKKVKTADGKTETEADFSRDSQVRGTPTLMFFNAAGHEYFRIPGLTKSLYFRSFIDYVVDGSALKGTPLKTWWAANKDKEIAKYGAAS